MEQFSKLASAAEDVAIFNQNDYTFINRYAYDNFQPIRQIHWSHDAKQIVAVPLRGKEILLTLVRSTTLQHVNFVTNEENTVAKFNSVNSRYLAIGTKVGKILMWDIKNNKNKKSFFQKNEVTCLQFNWNSTYIASGATNGKILIFGVVSGHISTLFQEGTGRIESLQYSFSRKSHIASSSIDGNVYFWDVNANKCINKYIASHQAPATCVCFSPRDKFMLLSVGLDKKLKIYDLRSKAAVSTMEFDNALTSIDVHDDSFPVAVGDAKGNIILYDTRACKKPSFQISAHETSISCLLFQRAFSNEKKLDEEIGNVYDHAIHTNKMWSLDAAMSDEEYKYLNKKRVSVTLQAFSPVRNSYLMDKSLCQFPDNSSVRQRLNFSILSPMPYKSEEHKNTDKTPNTSHVSSPMTNYTFHVPNSTVTEGMSLNHTFKVPHSVVTKGTSLNHTFKVPNSAVTEGTLPKPTLKVSNSAVSKDTSLNNTISVDNSISSTILNSNKFQPNIDIHDFSVMEMKKRKNTTRLSITDIFSPAENFNTSKNIEAFNLNSFLSEESMKSELDSTESSSNDKHKFVSQRDVFKSPLLPIVDGNEEQCNFDSFENGSENPTSNSEMSIYSHNEPDKCNVNKLLPADENINIKNIDEEISDQTLNDDLKKILFDGVEDFTDDLRQQFNTFRVQIIKENLDFINQMEKVVLTNAERLEVLAKIEQLKLENKFYRGFQIN